MQAKKQAKISFYVFSLIVAVFLAGSEQVFAVSVQPGQNTAGNTSGTTAGRIPRVPDIYTSIYVTAAPGISTIKPNSNYPLTWRMNDPYETLIGATGNVNIVSNTGQTISVAENVDLYTGRYNWNVPTMQNGTYRVQVCSQDMGGSCYTSPHSISVGSKPDAKLNQHWTPSRFPRRPDNSEKYYVGYTRR